VSIAVSRKDDPADEAAVRIVKICFRRQLSIVIRDGQRRRSRGAVGELRALDAVMNAPDVRVLGW
jgi:hypothetical protein